MRIRGERWLLPEGFEELLPPHAMRLERCRRRLIDLFDAWGYELVITPFIEYLDALLTGTGADLDLRTFKLIDQLSGRLLGIRADMTPQVARLDAHHLRDDRPVRLCYIGSVLHALPDDLSGSRCPLQVGAELFGHAGVESDCEVLGLMLATLAAAGVHVPVVDLGHVGIYRALAAGAGLDVEQEGELHEALQRKARDEIAALVRRFDLEPASRDMLNSLADLNGGPEVLADARRCLQAAGPEVHEAIDRLARMDAYVAERWPGTGLHFDLAELRGYRYHTGVVFAALVPGYGQGIARGGRYDSIGRAFGKARPATGFSTDLRVLVARAAVQDTRTRRAAVLAPWAGGAACERGIERLRATGERVVYRLPGQAADGASMDCDRELRCDDSGNWLVVPLGTPQRDN